MLELESFNEVVEKLRGLIRTPAPELNKDAVKALSDCALKDHLSFIGIRVVTDEAFKLVFAFTPEQSAS